MWLFCLVIRIKMKTRESIDKLRRLLIAFLLLLATFVEFIFLELVVGKARADSCFQIIHVVLIVFFHFQETLVKKLKINWSKYILNVINLAIV